MKEGCVLRKRGILFVISGFLVFDSEVLFSIMLDSEGLERRMLRSGVKLKQFPAGCTDSNSSEILLSVHLAVFNLELSNQSF